MTEFGKKLEPVLLALKKWAKEQILPGMNLNKMKVGVEVSVVG